MENERDLWDVFPAEIREWFRSGATSASGKDEVEQLLDELAPWVSKSAIMISRESQKYFDLMQNNYPIGFNRIAWEAVRDYQFIDVLEMDSERDIDFATQVDKLLRIRGELEGLIRTAIGDDQSQVIWVGDDYELSLKMQPRTFLECYAIPFTTPQHSYVIPPDCHWCLNYAMEGYLCFGFAKNSIATGPINVDDKRWGQK